MTTPSRPKFARVAVLTLVAALSMACLSSAQAGHISLDLDRHASLFSGTFDVGGATRITSNDGVLSETLISSVGGSITAHTSGSANSLNSFLSQTTSSTTILGNFFRDTYTVSGANTGELVDIVLNYRVEGSMQNGPHVAGGSGFGGRPSVLGAIGHSLAITDPVNHDNAGVVLGALDSQIVRLFEATEDATISRSLDVDFTLTRTYSVAVGSTFDVAYELSLAGSFGFTADFSSTATIDFVVPDGVTLTSKHGWQSPSAESAQVDVIPEPSSLMLFGIGALALVGIARRRRRLVIE